MWKAGVRWSFLSTAEKAKELAKCVGANWEGQADEIEAGQNSVVPLYCIRGQIASYDQTALGSSTLLSLAFIPIADLGSGSICCFLAIETPCTNAQYIFVYWTVFPGEHI